jgi:SanA protein
MKRAIISTLLALIILPAILLFAGNAIVVHGAKGKVFNRIEEVAPAEYGLLLGTTPQARIGGNNYFFTYRIDATEALYKAGKVTKVLISGDENSLGGIDETQCMKDTLVARGVPADAIVLDCKGFSTIESVVRARQVYGCDAVTIISQQFHNERAVYLAEQLRLDYSTLQAYNAQSPRSKWAQITYCREYLARVKMFIDIIKSKLNSSTLAK